MENTTTQEDEALKLFRQVRDCMNKQRPNLSIKDIIEIGKIVKFDFQRHSWQRSKHADRIVQARETN